MTQPTPAPERPTEVERWSLFASRVLAPNPGPMTLDGTNSYVLRAPGHTGAVVVDPGPDDEAHLGRLAAAGPVELILLTHHHVDHVAGVPRLVELTGAPVRAFAPALCRGAVPLADGERIEAGGVRIDVVATPGHTTDSLSFHLVDDAVDAQEPTGTMITGDTILGRGTTVIAHPDGSLGAYLGSLDRLAAFGAVPVLPAHGPRLDDLAAVCGRYAAHRAERLDAVRAVLARLGLAPSDDPEVVAAVVDVVYADIDPSVRFAAEASTRAQLEYLAGLP